MTSNQALFASYLASAKSSAVHAVGLGHKLQGQEAEGFQTAHAEVMAAVRHLNSAIEKIQPAINAEMLSDMSISD